MTAKITKTSRLFVILSSLLNGGLLRVSLTQIYSILTLLT